MGEASFSRNGSVSRLPRYQPPTSIAWPVVLCSSSMSAWGELPWPRISLMTIPDPAVAPALPGEPPNSLLARQFALSTYEPDGSTISNELPRPSARWGHAPPAW